jgi:hypothetical protein
MVEDLFRGGTSWAETDLALKPFEYYVGHSLDFKATFCGLRCHERVVLGEFVAGAAAAADSKVRTALSAQVDSGFYVSASALKLRIFRELLP